ncbi:MAG: hypothetical protein ACFFED_14870 [Candidatus Thorarchaeota archaeon]
MSDWDIDDIFDELFKNMRRFMQDGALFRPPEKFRHSGSAPKSEEIIQYDDHVLLVMELGPQFSQENTTIEMIQRDERRILEIKSFVNGLVRRYGMSSDMTGDFDWDIRNGMLEVILKRVPPVKH